MKPYLINTNCHDFACWASGRAASVRTKGKTFNVGAAKRWLESAKITEELTLEMISDTEKAFDIDHLKRRRTIRKVAKTEGFDIAHGQAAKLINVYMKSRYINENSTQHPATQHIHPPIDRLLLLKLGDPDINWNGLGQYWRKMARKGWSNFDEVVYQEVIDKIRIGLGDKPLWAIEKFWPTHQF